MAKSGKKVWNAATAFLGVLSVCSYASAVYAWKPTTHVHLAEQAMGDALDDGKITIYKVNYLTGNLLLEGGKPVKVGDYAVDPNILSALRQYPAHYRAGVLGPDAYPDILTGQQAIHPNTNSSGGTNAWLQYLWNAAARPENKKPQLTAFVLGYLTHAAGDMYGHTFINHFTGAPFEIAPPKGPENAIKHIVLEGYVDKLVPSPNYDVRIDGVEDFIYNYLVNATPGSFLDTRLLTEGGEGSKFAVPRRYSTIRAKLVAENQSFDQALKDYDVRVNNKLRDASACKPLDFSCSRVALTAQAGAITTAKGAYYAANKPKFEYRKAWIDDIDVGLRAWPQVSHEVAKALFFNPQKRANTARAKELLTQYAIDHLIKMEGSPDAASSFINVFRAIVPDFQFLKDLKKDFYRKIVLEATGVDIEDLEKYLSEPATYFDQVMTRGVGEKVDRATFHAKYWPNPDPRKFNAYNYPAMHNTILMSKLILLSPSEGNRLRADLGDSSPSNSPNMMLGFISTLDGDNEWSKGMPVARTCRAYTTIFMMQPGERRVCSP